jgi:hypothetical protein
MDDRKFWNLYLLSQAFDKELNSTQTQIFVSYFERRKFHQVNQTQTQLAQKLNIAEDTCKKNLTTIYEKFNKKCSELGVGDNCPEQQNNNKSTILYTWLNENYDRWYSKLEFDKTQDISLLSSDELWKKLIKLSQYSPRRLGLVDATKSPQSMSMIDEDEGFLTQVVSKSLIYIEMEAIFPGHLILLDRDATGEIIVLSPSPYIRETKISRGRMHFPQENAPRKAFKPSTLGEEMIVAIVFPDIPNFSWCKIEEKCTILDRLKMLELLDYLKTSEPTELIYTRFGIVPR